MPFEILATQGVENVYQGDVRDRNCNGLPLGTSDELSFLIGRFDGLTPALEVDSGTPTPGGSSLTILTRTAPATYQLVLSATDLAQFNWGPQDAQLDLVTGVESTVDWGIVHIEPGLPALPPGPVQGPMA